MALSVRALAAQRELGVRVVAGGPVSEQPITWVHVSELDDPTPFLSGGELLLTTGLFVRDGIDFSSYVERLCRVGVLGLGFGIGLSFDGVPDGLIEAADRHGLALLEVPRRTPFIALSRAVSNALAADEYAAVTRTFTAQQELTRAALAPDSPGRLIRLLARKVDGWVVLVDDRGAPLALGGARAEAMVPAVAVEVSRLREHRGSVGAGFEIDRDGGSDAVSLQPVGAGRRRAYLAVGRPGPLPPADRHLVNAAVMLLTLGLERPAAAPDAVAAVRSVVVRLALDGRVDLARPIAGRIGIGLPDGDLAVLASPPPAARPTPPRADQLRRRGSTSTEWDGWDASRRLHPRGGAGRGGADRGGADRGGADLGSTDLAATDLAAGDLAAADLQAVDVEAALPDGTPWSVDAGELIVVTAAEQAEAVGAALAGVLAATGRTVGRSAPSDAPGLAAARDQARRAAAAAADRGVPTLGFAEVASSGIAALVDPDRAAAFAASLLAPLVEHDRTGRGDLVTSLRAWLAHHGQWDPAAAALGVHRHTLRRRMDLAGRLLDRDLDSPTVRSELWLALAAMVVIDDVTGP